MVSEETFCVENCPLVFQCSKRWHELKKIDSEPEIRFCSDCQKPVYKVDNNSDYEKHAAAGHCVALYFNEMMIGVPEIPYQVNSDISLDLNSGAVQSEKQQPQEHFTYRDPEPMTPERMRKARYLRDLSELEPAAKNGYKPAIEALAKLKAEHPDLSDEFNVQKDN